MSNWNFYVNHVESVVWSTKNNCLSLTKNSITKNLLSYMIIVLYNILTCLATYFACITLKRVLEKLFGIFFYKKNFNTFNIWDLYYVCPVKKGRHFLDYIFCQFKSNKKDYYWPFLNDYKKISIFLYRLDLIIEHLL